MKFTTIFTFALAGVLGITSCTAEEAQAPKSGEALDQAVEKALDQAPAAKAAVNLDAMLAYIPEAVVSADGGKVLVTREALLKDLKPVIEQAIAQGAPVEDDMVKRFIYSMADRMALNTLVLDAAKAKGIVVDEAKCQESLTNVKAELEKQQPGAFAKELEAMGMTEAELLTKIRESNMVAEYLQGVAEAAGKVAEKTEADAKEFYDANPRMFAIPELMSASHILVQFKSAEPTDEEDAAAFAKCQEIKAKLAADASNFADLAKEFSDCPSKAQGGSLGQFPAGSMVPEFEAALKQLETGKVSDPVRTQYGYHLILAGAKTEASTRSFDEVKEQVIAYLNNMAKRQHDGEAVAAEFARLRDAAKVKINLPEPPAQQPMSVEAPEEDAEAPAEK